MGAASKVLAVAVIGLTVVGCGLTRQVEQQREVAQRAADDSRCRSYGFKTDADLARCRMQLDVARLRRRSASGGDLQTRIHYRYRYCVAMRSSHRDSVSMLIMY